MVSRPIVAYFPPPVRIEPFGPSHAAAFDRLNRAWLVDHGLLEPADEVHLSDPHGSILNAGGQILVAVENEEVVGTCAILPHGPGTAEIVKLTVAPAARGQGLGRKLLDACLAWAREHDIARVTLLSSTRLGSALKLYEAMGFERRPLPADQPYATADVYMEISL